MGLLDSVLAGIFGGGGNSALGGVLGQILGGGSQGGPGTPAGGMTSGGGLGELLGQLRQAGLGSQVDSWISGGQNQSVSPQQLHNAFGEQQVNSWAGQAGMQPHDFLSQLSQHLPNAVDGVTPDGRLPDEGTASV
jgi:uncharacterized protein YidB (DUF937 family)